jgi:hypothetical protein
MSQLIEELSFSPIALESNLPLSQYCRARLSEIRRRFAVDGAIQSVGSTGSHTTKTLMP